jgi:hypothetical protein
MFEIILPLFYLIIFNLLIVRYKFFHLPELGYKASLLAFNLKLIAGVAIWFIYTYYYTDRGTGDQYRYFDDAAIMFDAFKQNPVYFFELFFDLGRNKAELMPFYERFMNWDKEYNYAWVIDNRTVIRFNALVHFFSWGNFHVHTLFMNMLSFTGLLLLFKSVYLFFISKAKLLFLAVFLMPTVLFWGSGVLKEGILIFGLGLFCFGFFNITHDEKKYKYAAAIIVGILVLAMIKVYVLLCLIPAALTYYVLIKISFKKIWLAFAVIQLALLLAIFNLKWMNPELDIANKLWFKRNDFVNVANDWDAKSSIPAIPFEKSAISILLHSPQSIYNALMRPTVFEIKSITYVMPVTENFFVLVLIGLMLFFFKKPSHNEQVFVMFALTFIVYLAAMIGLVTPILGAIVRYKLPIMPFILMIIICCLNIEKLSQKIPLLKKLL